MMKSFRIRPADEPSAQTGVEGSSSNAGSAFVFGLPDKSSATANRSTLQTPTASVSPLHAQPAHQVVGLINKRHNRVAFFKHLELPLLLISSLLPPVGVWVFQGRELFSAAFTETSLAVTGGIVISWYALSRLKDHANSRHLSYVLPVCVTVFTSILAVLALLRVPYSASFFGIGGAIAVLTSFALAVYGRRMKVPHLVIPGGRTDEIELSDHFYEAPHLGVLERLIESGSRNCALVVDLHHQHLDTFERLFARAALNGIPVYHYREVAEMQSGQVKINHLSENDLGSLNPNMSYTSLKRIFDFAVSCILIPLALPFFLLIGLIIKLDSPGPAFFLQERMGFRGKPFVMVKFRTMRVREDRGQVSDQVRDAMTTDDDIRITRVGAILRKTRIDELPQVINVFVGDMSFIGPRPEAIALSQWYEAELPFYSYRHIVRPGITGWAQVNQGHVTDVSDVLSKLRYDFYYIKHFSLWLDLLTTLKTLRVIVTGAGAR